MEVLPPPFRNATYGSNPNNENEILQHQESDLGLRDAENGGATLL